MKKKLRAILSVMLSITIMISSMSFIIESHFCGDNLIDSSLFGHAQSCGMEMSSPQHHHDFSLTSNCCHTKVNVVKKVDQPTLSNSVDFTPITHDLFYHTVKYLLNIAEEETTPTYQTQNNPTPLLHRDYCALFEVFIC